MLTQFLPGLIMFAITFAFVTLMFLPITIFKQKNELVRFYWTGVWLFIAMIAALAGGAETLMLIDYDARNFSVALLSAFTVCFVLFVIFGWFRLSFVAIRAAVSFWFRRRRGT